VDEFADNQLNDICNLIQEAAHLLTVTDAVDLELFRQNSYFDWGLEDRQSCQPNNVVKNFLLLLDDCRTGNYQSEKEYSDEEVLAQLKTRIKPLFAPSNPLPPGA